MRTAKRVLPTPPGPTRLTRHDTLSFLRSSASSPRRPTKLVASAGRLPERRLGLAIILRSIYLPRILGVLMCLSGLGLLTYLVPPLAHAVSPYNLVLDIPGEGSLMLWLIVMGINVQRWHKLTGASGSGGRMTAQLHQAEFSAVARPCAPAR